MPNIDSPTALKILHAACMAIDGKPASTFKPELAPYPHQTFEDFGQDKNDSTAVPTPRTKAMLLTFALLTDGRIPYVGVETGGKWMVIDDWVAGALVKGGHAIANDDTKTLDITQSGWELIAETIENLA